MSQNSLEQRLHYLESCEAIRNMVGRYATAADQRNNPEILYSLFHPDAVWCAIGFGTFQGRQNILDALSRIAQSQILWSLHIMAQPDIEVCIEMKTARASWMLWEICHFAAQAQSTGQDEKRQQCLGGFYQSTLSQNEDGIWKFDRVELHLTLNQAF